jgi:hypothetical protein
MSAGPNNIPAQRRFPRSMPQLRHLQEGRWGYILAWLLGVPIPILVLIYLLRGCT